MLNRQKWCNRMYQWLKLTFFPSFSERTLFDANLFAPLRSNASTAKLPSLLIPSDDLLKFWLGVGLFSNIFQNLDILASQCLKFCLKKTPFLWCGLWLCFWGFSRPRCSMPCAAWGMILVQKTLARLSFSLQYCRFILSCLTIWPSKKGQWTISVNYLAFI